jgi:hypothetical protein
MSLNPTRRRFVMLAPFAGMTALAACSRPEPPTPAQMPVPTPLPMPVTPSSPTAQEPTTAPAPTTANLPIVDAQEAKALSFGYVAIASNADKARFPMFVAGSACSNCALYQGAAGETHGPCAIFIGQRVASAGWCSAWAKKA